MLTSLRSRRLHILALTATVAAGTLAAAVEAAGAAEPIGAVNTEAATSAGAIPAVVSSNGTTLRTESVAAGTTVAGAPGKVGAPLVNQPVRLPRQSVGTVGAEVIIGVDNRTAVNPTTSTWATAGTVLIHTPTDGWCTGFMIGPDTVGTAGHCVFHNKVGKKGWWNWQQMKVYPAYNGFTGVAPYGSCSVRSLHTNVNWMNTANNWDYDYGAIKLNCSIGNTVGWYGYTNSGYNLSTVLSTQGYPSDKAAYTMWRTTGRLLSAYGTAQWLTDIDIRSGQSGSPVYRTDAGCNRCVVAIVSWEPISGPIRANGLNRINPNSMALFNQVKAL